MAKVSVSLDDDDLRWLKERARRLHGGNLSAAIAEATRLVRHNEALGTLLDDLGAPVLSAAEIDELEAEFHGTRASRSDTVRATRSAKGRRRVA